MTQDRQAADALVGAVLDGSYRIEGMLGEGGMGAVYHATQLRLDKAVAIKVMARELSAAPEALARFHREALVTSNLGHPNIVQVFDLGTAPGGEPFLVMELLAGEDLEHRVRREGRLPPAAVLHIVKQVGAALMATHGKGIVHRDLKPANIYLLEAAGAGDFVKVLDFGISKVRSATTKLTRTASIMGTPGYMSPEQAKGRVEDIDEKTDQWSLACIVWECLSGEPPFQGDSPLSTLFQVVNEPPPPLLPKVPGLHPKVEDVLLRALCKKKDDRFASVSDFVVALEEAVTGSASAVSQTVRLSQTAVDAGPAARPIRPTTFTRTAGELDDADLLRPRSRAWIWAAAGVAALLVVGAILFLRPSPAPQPAPVASPPAAPAPEPPPAPEPVQVVPAAEPPPAPPAAEAAEKASVEPGPAPRAPGKKKRVRAASPPEPKGAQPARRRAVPRMIEDL
jgi:hypothetical protein